MQPQTNLNISGSRFMVKQVLEVAELFGFETRNKYQITSESGEVVGFAAEQSKGFLGLLARMFLGHWRPFEIHVFSPDRRHLFVIKHPFRFYFKRLMISHVDGGTIGSLERRFSIFSKRFDVLNANGQTIMEVSSPFWRIWTFPFTSNGEKVASIQKKWTGLFAEGFTDKDNFLVEFNSPQLKDSEKHLVLLASLYVDLMYFENKASNQ